MMNRIKRYSKNISDECISINASTSCTYNERNINDVDRAADEIIRLANTIKNLCREQKEMLNA